MGEACAGGEGEAAEWESGRHFWWCGYGEMVEEEGVFVVVVVDDGCGDRNGDRSR